jgi:DNA gyrase/topoisomerase IV subunit B
VRLDVALQWTQSTDEHVRSYVNGIPTGSGGTHENGFRSGLGKAVRNPRTRRLLKVEISDQIITDRVINELMGKDPSARFRFIMDRAEEAEELDV